MSRCPATSLWVPIPFLVFFILQPVFVLAGSALHFHLDVEHDVALENSTTDRWNGIVEESKIKYEFTYTISFGHDKSNGPLGFHPANKLATQAFDRDRTEVIRLADALSSTGKSDINSVKAVTITRVSNVDIAKLEQTHKIKFRVAGEFGYTYPLFELPAASLRAPNYFEFLVRYRKLLRLRAHRRNMLKARWEVLDHLASLKQLSMEDDTLVRRQQQKAAPQASFRLLSNKDFEIKTIYESDVLITQVAGRLGLNGQQLIDQAQARAIAVSSPDADLERSVVSWLEDPTVASQYEQMPSTVEEAQAGLANDMATLRFLQQSLGATAVSNPSYRATDRVSTNQQIEKILKRVILQFHKLKRLKADSPLEALRVLVKSNFFKTLSVNSSGEVIVDPQAVRAQELLYLKLMAWTFNLTDVAKRTAFRTLTKHETSAQLSRWVQLQLAAMAYFLGAFPGRIAAGSSGQECQGLLGDQRSGVRVDSQGERAGEAAAEEDDVQRTAERRGRR